MLINISTDNGIEIGDSDKDPVKLSFKELGKKEQDIEEFLSNNIELIVGDETLLIVGRQVVDTQRKRSDLTAIDKDGNLVLIEIKRDKEDAIARKEPLELQSIRYAAALAKIKTTEELADKVFGSYIEKYTNFTSNSDLTSKEYAKKELDKFLEANNSKTFNTKQRIILIASDFDVLTLSTVAWLIQNKIDISCYSIMPTKINKDIFLEITKILPVRVLEGFFIEVMGKTDKVENKLKNSSDVKSKTSLPRMKDLLDEWKLLEKGDEIYKKNNKDSNATIIDSKYVDFNGEKMTFNEWGKKLTGWSSICIYDWAVHSKTNKTLSDLRTLYSEQHEQDESELL